MWKEEGTTTGIQRSGERRVVREGVTRGAETGAA